MKKNIIVDYFSLSKKWPRRIPKIKEITKYTIKLMNSHFNKKYSYNISLIFADQYLLKNLNKVYKNKFKDTDVLTFVTKFANKDLGKNFYCDIFFSIDTINKYVGKNNISLYDHFNHLLIHSLLHVNGYDHKNIDQYNKMKNLEIKLLKKIGIKNPYKINDKR